MRLAELTLRRATLDEVFLALTGRRAVDRRIRQHDRPGAGVTLDRTLAGPPAADLPAAPAPPSRRTTPAQWASQSLTMAWRSLVQIKHNPSELLDLSIQPIMFVLLFTFVFGGAIGGSTDAYLQFSLGGLIAQNALFLTVYTATGLATDLQKGTFDRFRSLPIARSAPLSGRIMGDVVRQLWSLVVLLAVGVALGFRITTSPLAVLAAFGLLVAFTVAFSWTSVLLGVLARDPEKVQILRVHRALPADVREQRLRAHRDDAGLAAGLGVDQPRDAAGRRPARAPGRRAGGRQRHRHAALGRGLRGGVRAARGLGAPHTREPRRCARQRSCRAALRPPAR